MNILLTFKSEADEGGYTVSVGTTYGELTRMETFNDEITETDKYSKVRYKCRIRTPGNFTPLPKHRVFALNRASNVTREMRIVNLGEGKLRGHYTFLVLEDLQRDNN